MEHQAYSIITTTEDDLSLLAYRCRQNGSVVTLVCAQKGACPRVPGLEGLIGRPGDQNVALGRRQANETRDGVLQDWPVS